VKYFFDYLSRNAKYFSEYIKRHLLLFARCGKGERQDESLKIADAHEMPSLGVFQHRKHIFLVSKKCGIEESAKNVLVEGGGD
jgi:hypothetical protein